jgi:hypothetical protein
LVDWRCFWYFSNFAAIFHIFIIASIKILLLKLSYFFRFSNFVSLGIFWFSLVGWWWSLFKWRFWWLFRESFKVSIIGWRKLIIKLMSWNIIYSNRFFLLFMINIRWLLHLALILKSCGYLPFVKILIFVINFRFDLLKVFIIFAWFLS